jgi:hypothetical protein
LDVRVNEFESFTSLARQQSSYRFRKRDGWRPARFVATLLAMTTLRSSAASLRCRLGLDLGRLDTGFPEKRVERELK